MAGVSDSTLLASTWPVMEAPIRFTFRSEIATLPFSMSACRRVCRSNDLSFNLASWLANGSIPATLKSRARSSPLTESSPSAVGLPDLSLLTFNCALTNIPKTLSVRSLTDMVSSFRLNTTPVLNLRLALPPGIFLPVSFAVTSMGLNA